MQLVASLVQAAVLKVVAGLMNGKDSKTGKLRTKVKVIE